jgi:dethiobiotin synthetase/adenosylmethionine--8-amino-7-oxononanoate aminotransferase
MMCRLLGHVDTALTLTAAGQVELAQQRFKGACLFSWKTPASPHLSAAEEGRVVGDAELLERTQGVVAEFLRANKNDSATSDTPFVLIEGAGGPLSPAPSGSLQADVYKGLKDGVKVLLVADPKLGGISTTLSALEALRVRGFTVAALVSLDGGDRASGSNAAYLRQYLDPVPVVDFPRLPPPPESLDAWYL